VSFFNQRTLSRQYPHSGWLVQTVGLSFPGWRPYCSWAHFLLRRILPFNQLEHDAANLIAVHIGEASGGVGGSPAENGMYAFFSSKSGSLWVWLEKS